MSRTFDAVIFDFDGTILDTEWSEFSTVAAEFRRHGIDYRLEEYRETVGRADHPHWSDLLQQRIGPLPDLETVIERRRRAHHAKIAATELRAGVVELIDRTEQAGLPLAVASSSPSDWVGPLLEERSLAHRFATITTRDMVARAKPWPDLFFEAARRLEVEPETCLVIEDSRHGVDAAKAAGMHCVAVPNRVTRGSDFSAADLVLDSLADLPWSRFGLG